MVESVPEAAQLQSEHLLAMLLRMRASVMLEATLGDGELDLVSLMWTLNAEIPDQTVRNFDMQSALLLLWVHHAIYHGTPRGVHMFEAMR